jgi:hypothetical protein
LNTLTKFNLGKAGFTAFYTMIPFHRNTMTGAVFYMLMLATKAVFGD